MTAANKRVAVLSDDLLARCRERAPGYDEQNKFFTEDFEELRNANYLLIAVPQELGGLGFSLAEVCLEQRRLASFAPATALALYMHIYWTGVAADLWRSGDKSLEWLLKKAVQGEVFAVGHAERGNDVPVLYSTSKAEPVEGGYRFTGRKSFGSLTPVWTFMGIHAMDTSDPESPKVVHAFVPRGADGCRIEENWDVLGMRATQSHDTVLEQVTVPNEYIARVVAPGAAGIDPFVLGVFAWVLVGFSNVYLGIAQRALELTIENLKTKKSIALTRPYAYHPGCQERVAEMVIELESIEPHLNKVARDWSEGVNHGMQWPSKLAAAKYRAVEGSWRVVDLGLQLAGGFGISRAGEMERLFRDARLGRLHPTNAMLAHEFVAKTALGVNLDDDRRWG